MAIVTTWVCDKCQKTEKTADQMWNVGIHYQSADRRYSTADRWSTEDQLWCRGCCEQLSIVPKPRQVIKPGETRPPEPTLEDKIRDIVRDAAIEFFNR